MEGEAKGDPATAQRDAVPPTEEPRTGERHRRIGTSTASMLIVASMIGTGVFTTTGFLLRDLDNRLAVMFVWLLGGVLALCGALAYAELTAALPENGGEYALLRRIYHPAVGFVSGWLSLIVGFSAPIAAAAVAFGAYAHRVLPAVPETAWAVGLIVLMTALHAGRVHLGDRVQNVITIFNVALIVVFVAAGLTSAAGAPLPPTPAPSARTLLSSELAVGLVYVSFSYSGWNAAAYVAGEVRAPARTLPRSLLLGTGLVTVLYLALNALFLVSAPTSALSGVLEVGHVAADHLFGPPAAPYVSVLVAVGLATTVGALIMTGPRVYERMGQDYPALSVLAPPRSRHGPVRAIVLQTGVALVLALTAAFDTLLTYIGFTLSLSAALTLAGVFVLRRREPSLARPYRAWGHPFTTGLALTLMLWMTFHTLFARPVAAWAGLGTIASGLLLYVVTRRRAR